MRHLVYFGPKWLTAVGSIILENVLKVFKNFTIVMRTLEKYVNNFHSEKLFAGDVYEYSLSQFLSCFNCSVNHLTYTPTLTPLPFPPSPFPLYLLTFFLLSMLSFHSFLFPLQVHLVLKTAPFNTTEGLLVLSVTFQKFKMPRVMILVSSWYSQSMEKERLSMLQEKKPLLVSPHHKHCTYSFVKSFVRIYIMICGI